MQCTLNAYVSDCRNIILGYEYTTGSEVRREENERSLSNASH